MPRESEDSFAAEANASLPTLASLRRRVDQCAIRRQERLKRRERLETELLALDRYLGISGEVTAALETLSQQLFEQLLGVVQEKLSLALQEILDQPITFRARADFKRGAAAVDFAIERDGHTEDILRGQGGSVANILSVGLRMFALTTLDPEKHRRFLVLDEQDCWLRPDLVPRLVKMVRDAGRALGFQVLLISHHEIGIFERYADRIYRFEPVAGGGVQVTPWQPEAAERD